MTKPAKKPRVRWVTLEWLDSEGACTEACDDFFAQYGSKAKVRPIDAVRACWRAGRGGHCWYDWSWWLLMALLPYRLSREWGTEHARTRSSFTKRRIDYRYARMISAEAKP